MSDIFEGMDNLEPIDADAQLMDVGRIEESIDEPHWKLDKDLLVRALSPFREIGGVASSNIVTKSVFMEREQQNLIIRGNNKDVYLESKVGIENDENVLDGGFVINVSDLELIVRRCFSKVILYVKDSKFVSIRLFGSDFYLDMVNVGKYLFDFVSRPPEYENLTVDDFLNLVFTMYGAMRLSVRPEDRKVVINGNFCYGSFLVSAVRVRFVGLPNMVLRASDLNFLRLLMMDQENISFAQTEDRIFFKGNNYELSTLKSDVNITEVQKSLEETFSKTSLSTVSVSLVEFREVINLISKLSNTTGMVEFYSKKEEFYVSYMTKTNKKSEFKVGDGVLDKRVTLSVEGLRKSLSLIPNVPTIIINSINSGLIIECEKINILLAVK